MKQSYVSSTLKHFVGRALSTAEDQHSLLRTILASGTLKFDPAGVYESTKLFDDDAWQSVGEITSVPAVCFADIPERDLAIHVSKYSAFGLAFSKEFLIKKGARPVWYLPSTAPTIVHQSEQIQTRFWDELTSVLRAMSTLNGKLYENTDIADPKNVLSTDSAVQSALDVLGTKYWVLSAEICWYLKLFDPSLAETDQKNYYLEREWRIALRDVRFSISDLDHVFVASDLFTNDLIEDYSGLDVRVVAR